MVADELEILMPGFDWLAQRHCAVKEALAEMEAAAPVSSLGSGAVASGGCGGSALMQPIARLPRAARAAISLEPCRAQKASTCVTTRRGSATL